MPDKNPHSSPGRRLRDAWAAGPVAIPGVFNALTAQAGRAARLPGGLPLRRGPLGRGRRPRRRPADPDRVRRRGPPTRRGHVSAAALRRRHRLRRGAERRADRPAVRGGRRRGHAPGRPAVAQALRPPLGQSRWSNPARWRRRSGPPSRARRDPDFVIIARTDARGVDGFDDAVRRARLYLEAGADAIFPEALESADEFARFARGVPAPLLANMTEFGKGPLLDASPNSGRWATRWFSTR